MREIYAQVGIRVLIVEFTNIPNNVVAEISAIGNDQIRNPPAGVNLGNDFDLWKGINGATKKMDLSGEEISLLGKSDSGYRTPTVNSGMPNAKDDIEVYYINKFNPDIAEGSSYPAAFVPDTKYANSVIVAANRYYTILAHEVMHVLVETGPLAAIRGHYGADDDNPTGVERTNLLVSGQFSFTGGTVIDSRRLTKLQGDWMRSSVKSLVE